MSWYMDLEHNGTTVRITGSTEESVTEKTRRQEAKWDAERRSLDALARIDDFQHSLARALERFPLLQEALSPTALELIATLPNRQLAPIHCPDCWVVCPEESIVCPACARDLPNAWRCCCCNPHTMAASLCRGLTDPAAEQMVERVKNCYGLYKTPIQASLGLDPQHIRDMFAASQERDTVNRTDGDIAAYCCRVLTSFLDFGHDIPCYWHIGLGAEARTLFVDFDFPRIQDIPQVKEVKYVISRDEFVEVRLQPKELEKLYDDGLYQIALQTIHLLFEANAAEAVESIVFNGFVKDTDKATGKDNEPLIMSLRTERGAFLELNLASVDPKACFQRLKGVAAPELHAVVPVAPVAVMDREDKRFITARSVAGTLDECYNLATMDWKAFEHLIREILEQEFSRGGIEVRVTGPSGDGGVDAIAFDPDPILGGKIVIQAKRWTSTIQPGAVRDLATAVRDEGAIKGILITTSDFGPDAHRVAQGKNLKLMPGSELLHLLEKHGHKARIDLVEARRLNAESARGEKSDGPAQG